MAKTINVHRFMRLLGNWDDGLGTRAEKLARRLEHLVRTGQIPAGMRVPSERQLATELRMARITVSLAFDLVRDAGLFTSRPGIGTFVSFASQAAYARGDARLQSFAEAPSARIIDMRSAALSSVPMVREEMRKSLVQDCAPFMSTHGYLPEGLPALRQAVADYYRADELATAPDQILVTTGAQQAVQIIAKSLVDIGDNVLIEKPSYRGAIEAFRAVGASLISIPTGEDGIDLDAFERAIRKHHPKLALIVSTVHNPTGSNLDEGKRLTIGALAERNNMTLVDDASTSETLLDSVRPRPLSYYSPNALTIGSASKGFWGGLRIGWIRAPNHAMGGLIGTKSTQDLGTSIPMQILTARLLPRIDEARAFRREVLGEVRENVMDALAKLLPDWHPYLPKGGASLWVRLPKGSSATSFANHSRRNGAIVLAGPTFSSEDDLDDHLRIAYSEPQPIVLEGIHRLSKAWTDYKGI